MRLFVLAALLVVPFFQDKKEEYELKWGMTKGTAAEYALAEARGGKPVPGKEKAWPLFDADLNLDGSNNLLVSTYQDLPWSLILTLPPGKVKTGMQLPVSREYFEGAKEALTLMHGFKPIAVRGVLQIGKPEKVLDRDCLRIDSQWSVYDLDTDNKGNKKVGKTELAKLTANLWVSLANTLPVKASYAFNGNILEFDGIKQGEEAKRSKVQDQFILELKKEGLKLDLATNLEAIHAAIKKGAAWLTKAQTGPGPWNDVSGSFAKDFPVGITALCVMALLHSGAKVEDVAVQKGFNYCTNQPFKKTYDVAATIMMYETRYLPLEQYEEVLELTEEKARKHIAEKISKKDQEYLQKATDWLIQNQTKLGTWGYPEENDIKDNSNTQYALLALKSASRCGAKIPSEVWKKILNYWLNTQKIITTPKVELKIGWMNEKEAAISTKSEEQTIMGAWGYFVKTPSPAEQVPDRGYGSMVCAGLTSLIIAESELFLQKELNDELRKRIESCKKSALAWLQHNYSVRGCPPAAGFWGVFHMYYLYSLERVGVLYGIQTIGGHDWYQEGAMLLVKDQRADGGWESYDHIPVLDTAFALLFLKKATMKVATK